MKGKVPQVVVHRMAKEKMLNVQEKGGKKKISCYSASREKKQKNRAGVNLNYMPIFGNL